MKSFHRLVFKTVIVTFLSCLSLAGTRVDLLINKEWKFSRENAQHAEEVKYNDAYWERISLPHTWNNLDGQDGGNDYYRGIGWYRKQLMVDKKYEGKSIYLKFEGVATVAEVFFNGKSVGIHKGNFGAFCYDVTSLTKFGEANIVSVKVNNAKDTTVAPLRGDFTVFGGIYRGVHLLVMNPVSISPVDYASSGVYVLQKNVTKDQAQLEITTQLKNGGLKSETIDVCYSVFDAKGSLVAKENAKVEIDSKKTIEHKQSVIISNPHLWNGRPEPYCYKLKVEVVRDGKSLDSDEEQIGLRYFSVNPDSGFYLNGKSYKLHGVNRHQDRENHGWAITEREHKEDFQLISEVGATVIRLPHYQHAQEFYNLCDNGGMVVWAELALVDEINPSEDFALNCKQQLTELIKQNYNHPSIFFWGLENELIPDSNRQLYSDLIGHLNELAKQLDPSRMTTVATRSKYDLDEGINKASDVVGVNVYRGWYEKKPEDFASFIDNVHQKFPNRSISVSEYGAGAGIDQHEYPAKKPSPRGEWHPEEWQNELHEVTWKAMAERPYLWGTFIWNMFDFAVDGRSEGEHPGRNDKGLVTYDRKVKKDAFYWYKANWNTEPMVYLTSKRFASRSTTTFDVKSYSNCDSVQLVVNGKELGYKESSDKIYLWKDISFKTGKNVVKAVGKKNGKTIEDNAEWFCKPNTSDEVSKEAPSR